MKNTLKRIWRMIKGIFKRFVLDSGLLRVGIDRVIKIILESEVIYRDELYKYSDELAKILKEEFGNIRPINNIIDMVVEIIITKYGSMVDNEKGGLEAKLKLLKTLLINEIKESLE